MKRLMCVFGAAMAAACLLASGASASHAKHMRPMQLCNTCIVE